MSDDQEEVFRAAVIMVNRARGVWPLEAWALPALDLTRAYDGQNRWVRVDGVVCLYELEARVYFEVVRPCLTMEQPEVPDASQLLDDEPRSEERVLSVLLLVAATYHHTCDNGVVVGGPLDHWLAGWLRAYYGVKKLGVLPALLQQLLARSGLWHTLMRARRRGVSLPMRLLPLMMVSHPVPCTKWLLEKCETLPAAAAQQLRPLCIAFCHARRHSHKSDMRACGVDFARVLIRHGAPLALQHEVMAWAAGSGEVLPTWAPATSPLFRALAQQAVPQVLLQHCDRSERVVCGASGIVVLRSAPELFAALEDAVARGYIPSATMALVHQQRLPAEKRYVAWLWLHAALVWFDRGWRALGVVAQLVRELDAAVHKEDLRLLQFDLVRHQYAYSVFEPRSPEEHEACIWWAPRWWFSMYRGQVDPRTVVRILASHLRVVGDKDALWMERNAELVDDVLEPLCAGAPRLKAMLLPVVPSRHPFFQRLNAFIEYK